MLYLLRHTQPAVESGICYGSTDVELREEFKEIDLVKVLAKVADIEVDRVYSSPLKRCRILAEAVGKGDVIEDKLLQEMDFGEWELRSWDEIFELEGGKEWFDDYLNCRTPNGESFADVEGRAAEFLEKIEGDNILIVSHAGAIRAILTTLKIVDRESAFDYKVEYGDLIAIGCHA